jgi:hypothetical protein
MSVIARYHEQLDPRGSERTCPRSWAMFSNGIKNIEGLKGQASLIKLHGSSVLDSISVDEFIQYVEGDLDRVVEPEEIAEHYHEPEVRIRVLRPVSEGRQDILNVMFERLCAYINNLEKVEKSSTLHKNVIKLLEEDEIPKEVKTEYTRVLSEGPMRGLLISAKLATQLYRVAS